MRFSHALVIAPCIAAALWSGDARAQNAGGSNAGGARGPKPSSTQFTLRREEAGGPDAAAARQRARAGDCTAALPAFDAAIKLTIEPTLRRDRGLCHDKLEHPFPAIEDYRAYLEARPEAPDAEQIRQRLAQLEEQVGVGGPSSESVKDQDSTDGDSAGASGSASMSVGEGGAKASASGSSSSSSKKSARPSSRGKAYDDYVAEERAADAIDSSPLLRGEGFIFGAFLHMPRFFTGQLSELSDFGYAVGGTIRYAFSPNLTLNTEIGYTALVPPEVARGSLSIGGIHTLVGLELKLPVSRSMADQILVRGGVGYERYTFSFSAGSEEGGVSANTVLVPVGVGYRHVFAGAVGLEFVGEGGPSIWFADEGGSGAELWGVIGGSVALVVGF